MFSVNTPRIYLPSNVYTTEFVFHAFKIVFIFEENMYCLVPIQYWGEFNVEMAALNCNYLDLADSTEDCINFVPD